jgi:DNA repair exonuclease SbcCD ATPase subunit
VILKRVFVDGFGKLVGRGPFEFSRGLTVIAGPNESGKSTLAECIMRLLFGFPQQQYTSDLDRYRPWQTGVPYRARLEFELDDGRGFETTRDFADDVKTVTRTLDTREQVDAWSGSRKVSPGQLTLNLSLDAYRAASVVGPGELQSKEDADFGALGERLAAVVGSAGDEGADSAILALTNFATKDIGSEASRTTAFASARADREQAELNWQRANERLRELEVTIEQRAAALAEADTLEAQCRGAEVAVAAARLRSLEERSGRVKAALAAVEQAEQSRDAIPAARLDPGERTQSREDHARRAAEIDRAISVREIAIAEAASAFGRADGREPERAALRAQRDACKQAIEGDEQRATQLRVKLDAASARAGDAPALDRAAVEQLEAQDVAVDAVESRTRNLETRAAIARQMRQATPMAFAPVLILAVVVLVIGLFEQLTMLTRAGIGALIIGAVMLLFYLSAAGKRAEKIRVAEAEAADARDVLDRAQADLAKVCRSFYCTDVASVRARFNAQRDCEAVEAEAVALARTLESRRDQLRGLEAQLESIGNLERDVLAGATAAESASSTLSALFDAAGVAAGPDVDARIAAFREQRGAAELVSQAEVTVAEARTTLMEALGSYSVDTLRSEIDQLSAGLREASPDAAQSIAAIDEKSAVAAREDLRRRLVDAKARSRELAAVYAAAKLPDIAELEERAEACRAEERRLSTAARAAILARDVIDAVKIAVHKSYLPTMNAALGEAIGQITSGRYIAANLNPADFSVRLTSAEQGDTVDPWQLSSGTIEQVNLALRSATAQALGSGEHVPLILDDALAHADPARAAGALTLLANAGLRGVQSLFFTQRTDLVVFARGLQGVVIVDLDDESTAGTNASAGGSVPAGYSEAGFGRPAG